MDFHLGARVVDRDGDHLGSLKHVIVDPDTKEVTEIVLGTSGLLGRDVIVPLSAVNTAESERIELELSKPQVDGLKDFAVAHYIAPPPAAVAGQSWASGALVPYGVAPVGAATGIESIAYTPIVEVDEQIPQGDVDIRPGTEVWATDGKVGVVREVIVDEQTKRVRGLIIQEGFVFHRDVEVGLDDVDRITPDRVILKVSKAELEPSGS